MPFGFGNLPSLHSQFAGLRATDPVGDLLDPTKSKPNASPGGKPPAPTGSSDTPVSTLDQMPANLMPTQMPKPQAYDPNGLGSVNYGGSAAVGADAGGSELAIGNAAGAGSAGGEAALGDAAAAGSADIGSIIASLFI